MILLLSSVLLTFCLIKDVDGFGYDPDIIVGFDEYWMDQELAPDYNISDPLPIHWYAKYHESKDLTIDLFIGSEGGGEWILIAEGLANTGTYLWDLKDPTVPDGNYILKVIGWNTYESYCYAESQFALHVYNKKSPMVMILSEPNGLEVTGEFELTWDVIDEDTPRYLITADIMISSDDGRSFDHLTGFNEDPGICMIDSTQFPNGDHYCIRIIVTDKDGLTDSTISGRFFIFNNQAPVVKITSPAMEEGIFGLCRIEWSSSDIDEPSDKLIVRLWYVTLHDNGKIDLLRGVTNHGYYIWDTSDTKPGPEGHLISIELIDSRGMVSVKDEVKVWILREKDDIFRDVVYPRDQVRDDIQVTWNTYPPVRNVSQKLGLWVYHRAPRGAWILISAGEPDHGQFKLDVRNATDGVHGLKIVIMDSVMTWIHDEIELQIEVYHELEPEMFIRRSPMNGTNATGIMEFEVAAFDGNGDKLSYMGLYCVNGGGWQIFDMAHGNYKQVLKWNTTDLPPGDYDVRIAVYDGSRYNLSTSQKCGPYLVADDSPPPSHAPFDNGSDGSISPMTIGILLLMIVLGIVLGTLFAIIRKERKKVTKRDMDTLKMNPVYVNTYFRKDRTAGPLDRLLPTIGGASPGRLITEDPNRSIGLDEEETARVQGYLDMLDPDLIDDVTRSDINCYEVLGVSRDANSKTIKGTYIGFVKRYHPDKLVGKEEVLIRRAQEELRRKNRAKAILLDPQKRALVDKMIRENEGGRIRDLSVKSINELKALRRK